MVNSKAKGKRYERHIAKQLTKLTGIKWYRVPGSGMYSTNTGTTDKRFKGDVYCDEGYDDVVIECKNTKDKLNINTFFNKTGKMKKYIAQCERERGNLPCLLFININYVGELIAYPYDYYFDDIFSDVSFSDEEVVYEGYVIKKILKW